MTQARGIFLSELAVSRKNAVECVAPFILWVSRGGADPHGTSNDGDQKMSSRIAAGLMMSATLGCAVATFDCTVAKAQFFQEPSANPFQRLFGFGASSSIPRTMVSFPDPYRPGTIVISTSGRRLYLVTSPGQALSYGIGVGRLGFTWTGTHSVSMKREWPDWTPPSQMLRRRPDLPRHMVGGVENPLGARAIYLGSSLYRIHGSNEPETIGQAVSSGCFRMTNEDVVDLYDRVRIGAKVVVLH
jgi:lipoprotein-anchoring transpeptidase ErfK/SrfK